MGIWEASTTVILGLPDLAARGPVEATGHARMTGVRHVEEMTVGLEAAAGARRARRRTLVEHRLGALVQRLFDGRPPVALVLGDTPGGADGAGEAGMGNARLAVEPCLLVGAGLGRGVAGERFQAHTCPELVDPRDTILIGVARSRSRGLAAAVGDAGGAASPSGGVAGVRAPRGALVRFESERGVEVKTGAEKGGRSHQAPRDGRSAGLHSPPS